MKWGVLGTGKIAGKFAAELRAADGQTLVAAGSRKQATAAQFCLEHGGKPLASYEQLLDEPSVEAIYISLPNTLHHPWTLKALRAGKHVLCEKPMATSADQAEEMFAAAKKNDRILVEAFMYRSHPVMPKLLQAIHDGAIGDVRLIRSHFTYHRESSANDVRYQADLAGGSLMDVGCYCINFARAVAGREPNRVHVSAHSHEFGVDDYAAGTLDFPGGIFAVFTCGMTVHADRTSYIGGTEGYLQIDTPWFSNGRFDIVRPDGTETVTASSDKGPYALEAEAFARAAAGAKPWITAEDTLGNMRVLDELRRQIT